MHGDAFQGKFAAGFACGKGTLTKANGAVITGTWEQDELCGEVTEVLYDDTKFKGSYSK